MSTDLVSIKDLSIRFGDVTAVEKLNLSIRAGERLALVGESGSGKTVTALSILRLVQDAQLEGAIHFDGQDILQKSDRELRKLRGGDIAMIFQEPMSALNPLYTIGNQIIETLQLHEGLDRHAARRQAIALLERTGVREPERRIDSFPHQLSGGQRQRAMIAMALACRPRLLIADEPTTALDVTIRARIVKLLLDLQEEEAKRRAPGEGMAILLITHDLPLVRRFAQRVAVMERGHLVEVADTETLFSAPQHPYTRRLLNSVPVRSIVPLEGGEPELLRTEELSIEYPIPLPGWRGWFRKGRFVAVDKADLALRAGETLGIVGESGSGKSTLALAILGLVKPASGEIVFDHRPTSAFKARDWRKLRSKLQVVFQDPFGSLSPRRTVEQIVGEGLALHRPGLTAAQQRERIVSVLEEVGLSESALASYPHEFSGGQRQRIAIARALILEPRILVLDEPTSALDVSIQQQVLELLVSLQRKYGLSYVLISHDLAIVHALSHQIVVMKDGRIVEAGEAEAVLSQPRDAYTRRLIEASL